MSGPQARSESRHWGRRLVWLVAIWALSVGALALAAVMLKAIMRLVGMTA